MTEARNRLALLVEAGLITVIDGRPGVPYRYQVSPTGCLDNVDLDGLPTPARLSDLLAAEGQAIT